ncbi:DNA-methyltransferase [Roseovarius pacificus]|uniref:DNA-methyltransferase n=1 Tax=Roseovarius pacificus TaxID=337701 RepID=UPI004039FBD8
MPELNLQARLCLSDVPYPLTSGGNTTGEMNGCFARDRYDNSGALFDMVPWPEMATLIADALAPDAQAVIMTSDREEGAAREAFLAAGFGFHRLLVWDKVTATPNRWYMPNCEFALFLYRGKARRISDCSSKALVRVRQSDVSGAFRSDGKSHDHPTEKPVELMDYWMRNSVRIGADELVIDPFMGSGATALAALRAGQPFVGIEKDPTWFDVSVARCQAALHGRQGHLFEEVAQC